MIIRQCRIGFPTEKLAESPAALQSCLWQWDGSERQVPRFACLD